MEDKQRAAQNRQGWQGPVCALKAKNSDSDSGLISFDTSLWFEQRETHAKLSSMAWFGLKSKTNLPVLHENNISTQLVETQLSMLEAWPSFEPGLSSGFHSEHFAQLQ